jgi:sugar lactone lactonase YvrE
MDLVLPVPGLCDWFEIDGGGVVWVVGAVGFLPHLLWDRFCGIIFSAW